MKMDALAALFAAIFTVAACWGAGRWSSNASAQSLVARRNSRSPSFWSVARPPVRVRRDGAARGLQARLGGRFHGVDRRRSVAISFPRRNRIFCRDASRDACFGHHHCDAVYRSLSGQRLGAGNQSGWRQLSSRTGRRYLHARGFERIPTDMYASLAKAWKCCSLPAFAFGRHSAAALVHLAFLDRARDGDLCVRAAHRESVGRGRCRAAGLC